MSVDDVDDQPTDFVRLDARDVARTDAPPAANAGSFGLTFGASKEMQRIYPLCQPLASTDVPVILEGETGTGKEVRGSSRAQATERAR